MLLFCPSCQSAFTGVSRCPRCGGLLLLPEEAPVSTGEPGVAPPSPLNPTPGARVVVGTVAALGLYLGLRKLAAGWVLAVHDDPDGWWTTAGGLGAVFVLQGLAVVFGAVLAAAGRFGGAALGAAVGGLCGGLFLAAEVLSGAPGLDLVLVLQPLILAVGGGVAGVVGGRVWPPLPELEMPAPVMKRSSSIQLNADPPKETVRPTAWLRIALGVALIVFGMGLAEKVRSGAEKLSGGYLKVETRGQGKFMSWQMATLAVLGGGALAAAGTGAGLRHGLIAGFIGAVGVIGMTAVQGGFSQPAEFIAGRLGSGTPDPQDGYTLLSVGASVLGTAAVGGCFGGVLFLPLAPASQRNRLTKFSGI